MTPYHSIDLSEIVEECDGKFLVLWSPDTAEESADYEVAAEFSTREEAEEFLKNAEEQPDKEDGPIGFVD